MNDVTPSGGGLHCGRSTSAAATMVTGHVILSAESLPA